METTLNKIWKYKPCSRGWEHGLEYLGKTEPDDELINLMTILESNGIKDAIWALRAVDGYDREIRLFACKVACLVLHYYEDEYPGDYRPRQAIETSALYAEGLATVDELNAAAIAAAAIAAYAVDAVDAAYAAYAAAYDAAYAVYVYAAYAVDATDAADDDVLFKIEKLFIDLVTRNE